MRTADEKSSPPLSSDDGEPREGSRTNPGRSKPTIPERLRRARFVEIPEALGRETPIAMGDWLHHQRGRLQVFEDGRQGYYHGLLDVDEICPHLGELRARLLELALEGAEACEVPAFEPEEIRLHATLYHNRCSSTWTREIDERARLTFAYLMHTEPKLFDGGEIEFLDGSLIEPKNGKLVVFPSSQRRRVRPVECWSALAIEGRWAISGAIYGPG